MHQIGIALLMYTNDYPPGRFPPDLETLMVTEQLSPDVFVCPSTDDTRAIHLDELTAGGHLSYVYIGAGLTKDFPADAVALYEPLSNHRAGGCNILLADGHTERLFLADAKHLIGLAQNGDRPIYWPAHPATHPSTQP
jgi:prepilin-type processing-associated H-X9-DG protein